MNVYLYVCACVDLRAHLHACIWLCTWMDARIYVRVCVCLVMHMSTLMCIYALISDVRGFGHHTCVLCTIVPHSAIIIGLTCN